MGDLHPGSIDGVLVCKLYADIDQALLKSLADPNVFYDMIVVQEYLFSHSKLADRMLAQLLKGAYHPLNHLGFGVKLEQPTIVAEALAPAASHDRMNIEDLFFEAETFAAVDINAHRTGKPKPLVELLSEILADETIRNGPRWSDLGG
ncbi:uncharacterized protein BDW70DRAFT_163218 [Aspergillus foveolatus]|uniref:uncharacterized protein n=1 Tax=Aspergillus foveolatus TaxID=210207 RepID=UPI003CCC9ED8